MIPTKTILPEFFTDNLDSAVRLTGETVPILDDRDPSEDGVLYFFSRSLLACAAEQRRVIRSDSFRLDP
jgi:hypothetical protein